ncbi:TIGR04211 family SH3 domain-containing protein [Marinobacterium arenosum]|uniref:TIGR04211 family SH3 domain-containing protein n=1 Tax=Marinobacterium arenosum TaxID=2862496 RepID=UPI001C96DD27|nr:TIGR04211 family SH3 domain-containing protein [Marinobacterium arenosum]MBY4677877.1 TIGR04211 family SH3 domain-containing protein [Marinobacterium arenosum]
MKRLVFCTLLLVLSPILQAATGHITDDVSVFMHGGPSNKYRITGRTSSGDTIEILKRDPSTKYVQIRTSTGREGWVDGKYVETGKSIAARLPILEQQLETSRKENEDQRAKYETLHEQYNALQSERNGVQAQIDDLNNTIRRLQLELDTKDESNLLRWFTHGGLVALGGVILGLILPMFARRKKRRDEW